MQDFRKLQVWQKAHSITLQIYKVSRDFPSEERFGLTNQIRRCAASIGANISEGSCRGSDADFRRFLRIAMGSAAECENHLILCCDLGLLNQDTHRELSDQIHELKKMLASFIKTLS